MGGRVSASTRQEIAARAENRCEYCRLPEAFSYFTYEVEHIISLKHGGSSDLENLAYACPICNRNKGSDLGTLVGNPPQLTPFFHPRREQWEAHFQLAQSGEIVPLTLSAEATIRILDLNHADSVAQRRLLIEAGLM